MQEKPARKITYNEFNTASEHKKVLYRIIYKRRGTFFRTQKFFHKKSTVRKYINDPEVLELEIYEVAL